MEYFRWNCCVFGLLSLIAPILMTLRALRVFRVIIRQNKMRQIFSAIGNVYRH